MLHLCPKRTSPIYSCYRQCECWNFLRLGTLFCREYPKYRLPEKSERHRLAFVDGGQWMAVISGMLTLGDRVITDSKGDRMVRPWLHSPALRFFFSCCSIYSAELIRDDRGKQPPSCLHDLNGTELAMDPFWVVRARMYYFFFQMRSSVRWRLCWCDSQHVCALLHCYVLATHFECLSSNFSSLLLLFVLRMSIRKCSYGA